MKKFLLWCLGIVLGLLLLIYVFVFSPIGNAIAKPILQSQITKYSPIALTLEEFSFGLKYINIKIAKEQQVLITLQGSYNIFTLNLDLALDAKVNDMSVFSNMAGLELGSSAFTLQSTIQGNVFDELEVAMQSDIAESDTLMNIKLTNLAPTHIKANITHLHIDEILALIGKKPYVSGLLELSALITGESKQNGKEQIQSFDGKALLTLKNGVFNQSFIKKDFGIDVPKTNFVMQLQGLFDDMLLKHQFVFDSNIGKITSNGESNVNTLQTNSTYNVNLSDLSAFTPLIGTKVRGAFKTNGTMSGDQKSMQVQGVSDVADSQTSYNVSLVNLALEKVAFDIQNLKVQNVLYMLYQPQYISANENASGTIWDFDKGISLQVVSTLKGITNNAPIKQNFNLDMPNTAFTSKSEATINKGVGDLDFVLDSALAKVQLSNAKINLNTTHLNMLYTAILPDLSKLQFLTGIKLAGEIVANGEVELADKLKATFHTQSLGGDVNATLNDDTLQAHIKDLDLISLLKMAQYPQVFSAKLNGNLAYNTTKSSGNLKSTLSNGQFLKSQLTDTIAKTTKFDMTGALFNNIVLDSEIKGLVTTSVLDMKSGDFSLNGKNIVLDLEKSTINANLNTAIKDNRIQVKLTGNATSPNVEVDFGELLKNQAGQILQKELGKQLDEKTKQKLNNLKGLFR